MSLTIDVKYFNSFLLKKTVRSVTGNADWAGLPWNPLYYPTFPMFVDEADFDVNWFVEESRIRGGYNNTEVDLGVRAYIDEDERLFKVASTSMIYSGIYNSRTSTNKTNVFSVGDDITKSVDPRYGSIQKLYASESDLLVLQESKVSRGLVEKQAIYSAEGNSTLTTSELVLGKIQPYSGDYGISRNPESFARKGYRTYFTDVDNGAVIRLSSDGMTEINKYGMEDYFRDEFRQISSSFKREVVDISWTIPWSTPATVLTVGGANISLLEYGMTIEGISGFQNVYIVDIGTEVAGEIDITLNQSITVVNTPQPTIIQAVRYVKDKVIGGYDNKLDNYVVSISYNEPSRTSSSGELVSIPSEDEEIPS